MFEQIFSNLNNKFGDISDKYRIVTVGVVDAVFNTKEEAITEFKKLKHNYGNTNIKCPNGSVINVWDV